MTPKFLAYGVSWTESESGWGQRPDGICLFPSWQSAKDKTKEQLEAMRAEEQKEYKGRTPEEYSFPDNPENPFLVQITEGLSKMIHEKGFMWVRSLPYEPDGTPNPYYKAPGRS